MSKRRGELFRIPSKGKIAGVCAGIADYFGWETWLVRILIVSGVLFGMPFLVFGYVAAWFILDKKPGGIEGNNTNFDNATNNMQSEIKVKARIWQAGEPPKQAFHDIRRKFNALEKKLRAMEHYVTSSEFTVSREINKL